MITRDTIVVGVAPRITKDLFRRVLNEANSPAAGEAEAGYDAVVSEGIDPAFALAIFHHESEYGHKGVTPKYTTKNPGNCRTSVTGKGYVIDTDVEQTIDGIDLPPSGRGSFVRFERWADGWRDLARRLIDPTYVYAKEGRRSIAQIIPRFAPAEDRNKPENYIAAVLSDMNRWIGEAPMAGDMPGVPFIPADHRHMTTGRTDPWPTKIIGHHTDGYDSLAWLTTSPNSDVSATVLLNHDGTIRAQLVRFADTPHTTGYMNDDSLSFEWERYWKTQKTISDTQYQNIGRSVATMYLAERQRGNPHFAGPIRRDHLADHNDFYSTTCPGNLDMGRVFSEAAKHVNQPEPAPTDPSNPWFLHLGGGQMAQYALRLGFRGVVEGLAQARYPADPNSAALALVGEPLEDEWVGVDGHSYQRCKRVVLHYIPGHAAPWDVIFEPTDAPLPARKP